MKYSKCIFFFSALAVLSSVSFSLSFCFADDDEIEKSLLEAQRLYHQRASQNVNPNPIDQEMTLLESLEGKAEDDDVNYKVLIAESSALYWQGTHSSTDEKLKLHSRGLEKAKAAIQLNDLYADGYYFAAIHLARWAEVIGVLGSFSKKGELEGYIHHVQTKMTIDLTPGEEMDGWGINRVLGMIQFKVPPVLGGSHKDSLKYLKEAYEKAPEFALNAVYYAEALMVGSPNEKKEAKRILEKLLQEDPNHYNPNRIPETLEEFELARGLRKSMDHA